MHLTKLLALDPNVLVAAACNDQHGHQLLFEIQRSCDFVRLAIDERPESSKIVAEYRMLLTELAQAREVTQEEDSVHNGTQRVLEFLTWLFDRLTTQTAKYQIMIDVAILGRFGCTTPVEPELIGVCAAYGLEAWMVVAGCDLDHPRYKKRATHDPKVIQDLKATCVPSLEVREPMAAWRALQHWTEKVLQGAVYPQTERELVTLIHDYWHTETEQLEFKQPMHACPPEDPILTTNIIIAAMKTVCAFSNAYGGKVLIGVDPQGDIQGFLPEFNGVVQSDDDLFRRLGAFWNKFAPYFNPNELRQGIVHLENGRRVIVIDVAPPSKNGRRDARSFDNEVYVRQGTENKRRGNKPTRQN